MSDPLVTTYVYLTAEEVALLREFLKPGQSVLERAVDAKLAGAQLRFGSRTDAAGIAEAMRQAKESPGRVVGVGE